MSKKVILTSGKRKTAIARAVCVPGKGRIRINNVPLELQQPELARVKMIEPVLIAGDLAKKVDINVRVKGGGFMGQADAVRTALAKAFVEYSEDPTLRAKYMAIDRTMITADARRSETKKFGGHGARARKQKSYR
ncbi:MAG: 30S ribosomal protein S9 [Candidatus Heimdallarchaeota archaeon]